MKKTIGIIIVSALMLTSCQTLMQTSRNVDTGSSITSVTLADLNVSDTRESYTMSDIPKSIYKLGEENVKSIAEAKILDKSNADILVEPRYHIEKKRGLFGRTKVTSITVSGRPASFTNFRTVEDSILFRPQKIYVNEKMDVKGDYMYSRNTVKENSPVKSKWILDKKRYVSAGFGFSASEEIHNIAYNFSFGIWKPISKSKRLQYGVEIGLSSQGFEEEIKHYYRYNGYYGYGGYNTEYTNYLTHNIHILPARLAYIGEIGRNAAFGIHIAPMMTIAYSLGKNGDVSEKYFGDLINLGFKTGLQCRYKKLMIDFNFQTGFMEQWSNISPNAQCSCTLNIGYMF